MDPFSLHLAPELTVNSNRESQRLLAKIVEPGGRGQGWTAVKVVTLNQLAGSVAMANEIGIERNR